MDPVSAAASIVTLLNLTETVMNYLGMVRNYDEDRGRLLREIDIVRGLLGILKGTAQYGDKGARPITLQKLDVPHGPFAEIKAMLETMAGKLAPSTGFKRIGKALMWQFSKTEVASFLNRLERQKSLLFLALQNDNMRLCKAIEEKCSEVQQGLQRMEADKTNDNRSRVLQWLTPPGISSIHDIARTKREPTTGAWFLYGEELKAWKMQSNSTLWLHGIVGSGKTILCSSTVEYMQQYCRIESNCILAYHFFDWNDSGKQKLSTMLRSILSQICQSLPGLPDALLTIYTQERNNAQDTSIAMLTDTLLQVLGNLKTYKVFIIIDALNECSQREMLLETLIKIKRHEIVSLLATSRRDHDIEDELKPLRPDIVAIQRDTVDADIDLHVHNRLLQDRKLNKWPDEIKELIRGRLLRESQGMFRWIFCQLEALRRCLTVSVLKRTLTQLPETLEESYDRIIVGIPKEYRKEARNALHWLAFSERPLHIIEVAEAAVMDFDDVVTNEEDKLSSPQDILEICSSLVTTSHDLSEDELRLAHCSVKEYLVGEHIFQSPARDFAVKENTAHLHIAVTCLNLLLQFKERNSLTRQSFAKFPLLRYAAQFWPMHVRKASVNSSAESTMTPLVHSILEPHSSECYLNWLRIFNPDYMGQPGDLAYELEDVPTPLYLASSLGLKEAVIWLLDSGAHTDAISGHCGTALQAACFQGHLQVACELLRRDADPNLPTGHFKSTLQAPCYRGFTQVAELLVEAGANVKAEGRFGSPMQAAARLGNIETLAMLLKHDAEIDAAGQKFHTALQEASRWGHEQTASFLLDNGAKVNAKASDQKTALEIAASNDHANVTQLLVDNGADVNAPAGDFGTPLQAASRWGSEKSVKVLLENGANPNKEVGDYGSALQAASCWGHFEIVRTLLEYDANVKARSKRHGTALQAAAHRNHDQIAQLLLDHGADRVDLERYRGKPTPSTELRKILEFVIDRQQRMS